MMSDLIEEYQKETSCKKESNRNSGVQNYSMWKMKSPEGLKSRLCRQKSV